MKSQEEIEIPVSAKTTMEDEDNKFPSEVDGKILFLSPCEPRTDPR